mgnify:CR=1 FL=1
MISGVELKLISLDNIIKIVLTKLIIYDSISIGKELSA